MSAPPEYQPFPLMDFELGLYEAKESWISPTNAFEKLENANIFRGQLLKRPGYKRFGRLGVNDTESVTSDLAGDVLDTTLSHFPVLPRMSNVTGLVGDPYQVRIYDDDGSGGLGAGGECFDVPTNIDFDTATSGVIVQEVTLTDVSLTGPGNTNHILTGGFAGTGTSTIDPLFGIYSDFTLGPEPEFSNRVLQISNAGGTVITDPGRELPYPFGIEFSDHSSTPQVITFNFGTNIDYNTILLSVLMGASSSSDGTGTLAINANLNTGLTSLVFDAVTVGVIDCKFWQKVGTIDYKTGKIDMLFINTPDGDSGSVLVDYEYDQELPVMGIHNFFTLDGNEHLVACNTRRFWYWAPIEGRFYDLSPVVDSGNSFGGNDDEFFVFSTFDTFIVLTNGKDPPFKYDPSAGGAPGTLSAMGTDYDADSVNEIDNALLVFRHKNRLVYLNTKEGGTEYKQRARWTPVNDVDYTNAIGDEINYYADAPTDDVIVTAGFVGEDLIVAFRRQFWRLRYTGESPEGAFLWERIPSSEGAQGKMSTVGLSEEIIMRGEKSIIANDGVSEMPIDLQIPDFTLDWNKDAAKYSYSLYSKELRSVMMTYAGPGEQFPEHVLNIRIDEEKRTKNYSVYTLPFHCFGTYRQTDVRTMNSTVASMNTIQYTMNETSTTPAFPLVLAGNRTGEIYEFGYVPTDDHAEIVMTVKTIRLNPFPWQRCHLGWIDLICAAGAGDEITIRCHEDYKMNPYYEQTLSIAPDSVSSEKVKRRFLVNRVANFHTIEVIHSGSLGTAIDAITPWFVPAGRMRDIA